LAAHSHSEDAGERFRERRMKCRMAAHHRADDNVGAGLAFAPGYLIPCIHRGDPCLDLMLAPFKLVPAVATAGVMPGWHNAGR
jgi:hypothetical protein